MSRLLYLNAYVPLFFALQIFERTKCLPRSHDDNDNDVDTVQIKEIKNHHLKECIFGFFLIYVYGIAIMLLNLRSA